MLKHKILYLWLLLSCALWWITLCPELISDITRSGKTHLAFPGWKAAFSITCGAFPHIIALMTLCCSSPFIVMLPQSTVRMTSYITVYPKHSAASAMCPMLISVPHIDIAPCHHCCYVCFLLKEEMCLHHLQCQLTFGKYSCFLMASAFSGPIGVFCCFGSCVAPYSSTRWDERRGTGISF